MSTDDIHLASVKRDFPILADGRLTYLDSAATSQKPQVVLDVMTEFYSTINANVHRGSHNLTAAASQAMENARATIARFIGASSPDEIVFTKNATEALNLVAQSWGRANLSVGDAVVLSELEHHANIVPWQILQQQIGFEIRWIPATANGMLDVENLDRYLDGAKLLSITAMSNVTGALSPVPTLAAAAHDAGALIAVDGCQSVPHMPTDVAELDIDFLTFSGHKMCGPTGIGVLWARADLLAEMPPFLGGGGMILNVTTEGFTPDVPPARFEAGTPPIAEIVGLGSACNYLTGLGMANIRAHEVQLTAYALRSLTERFADDITIHGPSEPHQRGGVFSFEFADIHPHDLSQVLDEADVSVRSGHHCAKPLMQRLGVGATARASVYLYNDEADIDRLGDALERAAEFFAF